MAQKISDTPGLVFDRIADLYDRSRSGYPDRLFDEILTYSGGAPIGQILEIGSATGQATRPLASRGMKIICLEPGENLARLARRNLESFKNVEVICSSFEDWKAEDRRFDLVFSANAIHWVDRKIRARKCAELLRPGGTLAVFRSFTVRNNSALERAIASAIGGTPPTDKEPRRWPRESEMRKSGYFHDMRKSRYEWTAEYGADAYVDLLSTLHRYHGMPLRERIDRFRKVHEIITNHGDRITVHYVTQLFLARRKLRLSWWRRLFSASGHFQW